MKLNFITKPPYRTIFTILTLFLIITGTYLIWSPGEIITDGRHNLNKNGIWIQHGWLGDDKWFSRNKRDTELFRKSEKIKKLIGLFENHGIKYIYPHLCPCSSRGNIAKVDHAQTMLFLDHSNGFAVLPWVGGVYGLHCFPESKEWRKNFITSVLELLQLHPRLAGIHVNIEPMRTGNEDFLLFLKELKQTLPDDKLLSIAAYPPPTKFHPFPDVHWDQDYFNKISNISDQMSVMMYDTAMKLPKLYQYLMSVWTQKSINWSNKTDVLLGVPVYDDKGVGYHLPNVENLEHSLLGIHAGLSNYKTLPSNYTGIAIYCEWEMDQNEWKYFANHF